ncbi:MAG TPA: nuclear transport factor 2 family protein [Thiomicrospira sp.]|jgi:steroid delta-isomerase|nr:nuclear transport factor 2 family protein [Thiomicrospira sp.]
MKQTSVDKQPDNINTSFFEDKLKIYANVFENLTEHSLLLELLPLFDEQVFFKDPFNQISGKNAVSKLFKHMFLTLHAPKFSVKHFAISEDIGYLHWNFDFYLSKSDFLNQHNLKTIDGMSQVKFNEQGLVEKHIDYWDSGEYVYRQIPILGWFIKQIEKRLSAA